jgi:hypothetical protein
MPRVSLPAAPASRRKQVVVEDLAHVHRGERDLGRADEIQLVTLDGVDIHRVGWEESGSVHRLLAHEHGRQHRFEALLHEPVEREAVERELEQREVALAVDEARPRHLRGALDVDPAVLDSEVQVVARHGSARFAPAGDLDGVLLRLSVRNVLRRRVRHAVEQLLAALLRGGMLFLGPPELLLRLTQLVELLGCRLPFRLRARTEVRHARLQLPPACVGRHQLVEQVGCALARECGAEPLRVVARCADVDHSGESRELGSR